MPRYLIERTIGEVSPAELDAIAAHSTEVRLERFPQLTWEHTHVVRTDDGLKAFCVYGSPDPESLRAHAAAAGLPVDRIYEVEAELSPEDPSTGPEILRYAAFTDRADGGNPAGVVLDASGLDDAEMQAIATEVGFSETAFVTAPERADDLEVRYFSPLAEVSFCGHATIATGVAWGERHGFGTLGLRTRAGFVSVEVAGPLGVAPTATLTSVPPRIAVPAEEDVDEALAALGWSRGDLDPELPPGEGFAGAWHLILAAATRERLADLDYDFDRLGRLMAKQDWTTVQLVHRTGPDSFDVRNPFPPGGVVEDPATGAAAAALGGYLRERGLVDLPAQVTIHQGDDMGRPSLLTVAIPEDPETGIGVSGQAVPLPAG